MMFKAKKKQKENETRVQDGKQVCPCCDRHCPAENLHCSRGKEHFGLPTDKNERKGHGPREIDEKNMSADEIVLILMRQCGHFLHHNMGGGEAAELSFYTEEEKQELIRLLKKCINEWKKL